MDNKEFMDLLEDMFMATNETLSKKEKEYSEGHDRFDQFKKIGIFNGINPAEALWYMAFKHITSIATMTKSPTSYNLSQWQEKLGDIRNYMFLLEGLVIDLGVR